ncbi:guanylate-binding protein 5-like [Engystomops pustulosus]|uniref:guanylate-binding protein 5-like n=1 Tax=Engystomops pustulosus TaxID=76066 RepID=UPI003AFB0353
MAPISKLLKPLCLIENAGDKSLSVNEEAKMILENISQPLVVVSIVGPYRSGKSYLLNKLSGDSEGGFSVGHTLSANTKGIWMRCVPHPIRTGHILVLLDTEGVGDVGKASRENDCMILSLAMLMSSAVIYNSKTAIDQDAVKKLSAMTEIHQIITQFAAKQDGEDLQMGGDDPVLPLLVWTLRDATLRLEINGHPVTADEYLENSLQAITRVKTPRTQEQNKAREKIRRVFPNRRCFVFDVPASDKEILSRMDQEPEEKLQSRFVEETKNFCQFILEEVPPKRLTGAMAINGSRFALLLQSYLDVVKMQDISFLENSVTSMFTNENKKAIKKSIEVYEEKMFSQHVSCHQEFQQIHEAAVEEATEAFKKLHIKHDKSLEEYLDELQTDLLMKKDEIWKSCEGSSLQRCNDIIRDLRSKLDQNLKENKYHIAGGHEAFISDKESIIQEYSQRPDKGVKAEDVLQGFLRSLEPLEKLILEVDQQQVDQAAKPKVHQVTNRSDVTQLAQYIRGYQMPPGSFTHILIQLFGFAGHGKSSFVNSCLFALGGDKFNDYAGEATSMGGKTIDRRGYKLTENITIVDNRGFTNMSSAQEWEIYAQLCNCVPLNNIVLWEKSLEERVSLVTRRLQEEATEVIVPVLIYSSQQTLNGEERENIREFLTQAQNLTRIKPFIVLTQSQRVNRSSLKDTFSGMGMENIYHLENYLLSDHFPMRRKHLDILTVLCDILESVTYYMSCNSNPRNQRQHWTSFLLKKAGTIL